MDRRRLVDGGARLCHSEAGVEIQGHCLLSSCPLARIQKLLLKRMEEETSTWVVETVEVFVVDVAQGHY
jgi:hypothetical protein